jgi:hypothetical protein
MIIKKTTVIFLIIIISMTAILIFIQRLAREPAPQRSVPEGEGGVLMTEPSLNYTVPVNTVPSEQEIEENIKNTERRREDIEKIRAEIENEKAKPGKETLTPPSGKPSLVPTEEERKDMESKGIITY